MSVIGKWELIMEHPTRRIPNLDDKEHITRWGTATLSHNAEIKLHILGMPTPFIARLNPAIILGRSENESNLDMNVDLSAYGAVEFGVSRQHAVLELVHKTV